jgi:hypothetical protein
MSITDDGITILSEIDSWQEFGLLQASSRRSFGRTSPFVREDLLPFSQAFRPSMMDQQAGLDRQGRITGEHHGHQQRIQRSDHVGGLRRYGGGPATTSPSSITNSSAETCSCAKRFWWARPATLRRSAPVAGPVTRRSRGLHRRAPVRAVITPTAWPSSGRHAACWQSPGALSSGQYPRQTRRCRERYRNRQ